MDLPSLAVVLRAALSHVPEERKAAEESLNQVSCRPRAPTGATLLRFRLRESGTRPFTV